MMVEVFHNLNPFAMLGDSNPFGNVDQLVKVAEVDTDDLEMAFRLTNHTESSWILNPQVTPEPGNHRSTSVGDVLGLEGKRYGVDAFGFTQRK
ncbi:MAG: hypothetical protein KME35_24260 [Aphanocapsa sp. GSE-SYN-MK-11-07L]|nr:hypothetical protein [Aphanocapsa sp. GSE-SYN-MK-11-07L]